MAIDKRCLILHETFRKQLCKMGQEVFVFVPDYPGAEEFDEKMNRKDIYRLNLINSFLTMMKTGLFTGGKRKKFLEVRLDKAWIFIHVQTEFAMGNIANFRTQKRIQFRL